MPIQCPRCGRQVSADDEAYLEWEALGPDGRAEVCPDCVTAEEQQAMDEDVMDLADSAALDDASDPRGDPH